MQKQPLALEEYIKMVGLLVDRFAHVETLLRIIFQQRIGISEEKLLVFTRSTMPSVSHLVEMLKGLNALEPMADDRWQKLLETFEQLGYITTLRDRIVHAGGHPYEDSIYLFPMWKDRRHSIGQQQQNLYEQRVIDCAVLDLQTIEHRFIYYYEYLDQDFRQSLVPNLHAPWRYKHRAPPRKNPNQKGRS